MAASNVYSLEEHSHRFAAWCAARAATRKLRGATNGAIRQALEASELPGLLAADPASWPRTTDEFEALHARWCSQIVQALNEAGVDGATYGRAAKVVAIYLKTRVVCGGQASSDLGRLAHPPIDSILLKALAKEVGFSPAARKLWRETRWTQLDAAGYSEVIASLRSEGLDGDGFGRVERWWVGD